MRYHNGWNVNQLAELQLQLHHVMDAYIAQCHEAAAIAPEQWREYWQCEAKWATTLKQSMINRTQEWIDHASGRPVELLNHADSA